MFDSMAVVILEDTNTNLYTIKDGIIVVKKGAVLPDGFTL